MSLEGGHLQCLDETGAVLQTVHAKGRKLTIGYFMTCDIVLKDKRSKSIHCEIEMDPLGKVSKEVSFIIYIRLSFVGDYNIFLFL